MFPRFALVAPLALAAVLPAQLLPDTPKITGVTAPTPAEQLSKLSKEKVRLTNEIQYAKQRVQDAKLILSQKMMRKKPEFRTIDAGKSASLMSSATRPLPRKFARVGTAEEMNYGGNQALVLVNDRAISEATYNDVMNYVRSVDVRRNGESERAQRVLYDMIRIEGIASSFIENDGEVQMTENLSSIQTGQKSIQDAAKEFGTVPGATADGAIQVARNSILGPYFEYVAFNTPPGQISRPFRNAQGYVVIKVNSINKGEEPSLTKADCQVVLFPYTTDKSVLQKAKNQVNSGQLDIRVRDNDILAMLPAMFKQPERAMARRPALEKRLASLQRMLKQKVENRLDENSVKDLKKQILTVEQQIKMLSAQRNDAQDADAVNDIKSDAQRKVAPLSAPKKKVAPQSAPKKKVAPLSAPKKAKLSAPKKQGGK
jgi:parvulin-like peptidyl-prolyl isomerase